MTAYLPGRWLAFVGPTLCVVVDAEWGDAVADECWSLVSRGCGHVELLDVVAALPGFALVGADRLRLAGTITALVGEESYSGKDARTWATHDLPAGAAVRLVVEGSEEDATAKPLPLVGGVVGVRELWLDAVADPEPESPAPQEESVEVAPAAVPVGPDTERAPVDPEPLPVAPVVAVPAGPAPVDGSTRARSAAEQDRVSDRAQPAPPAEPEPEPPPEPDSVPAAEQALPDPVEGETWLLPPNPNVHSEPKYDPPTYARVHPAPGAAPTPSGLMDDILGQFAPAPGPGHPPIPNPPTKPLPWVLVFPTGRPYTLDRAVLLGREPASRGTPPGMTLLAVPAQHTDVSRVHVEVRPSDRGVEVVNRSENGTLVRTPDGHSRHLMLGESTLVDSGTVLQLSQGYGVSIEADR